MLLEHDPVHAFMPYPAVAVASASTGPLAGLTLAVKDLFDVEGYRTGCGCPAKLAASPVAATTAPTIQRLLDAGARFVGKTHTDELAWALYGMNAHFGTPTNPAAPDRIPGGSSSGSAAAVAAGLADIAVGTDTGGSVRAPASFCGLWGLRPTHGRISLAGCMELAASLDTCGLFARDAATLLKAAEVAAGDDTLTLPEAPRFLRPTDMLERLGPEPAALIAAAFAGIEAEAVEVYPEPGRGIGRGIGDEASRMDGAARLYEACRIVQSCDAKRAVLPFIASSGMPLAAGLDERVAYAAQMTDTDEAKASTMRAAFTAHVEALLGTDGVLFAPAVHDAPFRLDAPRVVFDGFRHDAMTLLCVAGLAGLPQIVFPAGRIDGAPYGASLIGPRGSDLALIALAGRLAG